MSPLLVSAPDWTLLGTTLAATKYLNGWLIGVLFFGLIFLGFFSGLVRAIQSRTWPRTLGKVVESTLRENSSPSTSDTGSARTSFEPVVRYTYVVNGKTQESKQIAIGALSMNESGAKAVADRYPIGAEVTVYYHPKLHYLAVLEPGRFIILLVLATLLTGFVALGVTGTWLNRSLHPPKGPWDRARAKAKLKAAATPLPSPSELRR